MTHSAPRLIIAGIIGLFSLAHAQEWEWQNPLPQGNDLWDVEFVNSLVGFAVGDGHTTLRTDDGGLSWRPVETQASGGGLSFADEQNGWIVAGFNGVFHTTDGGETWEHQAVDSEVALTEVSFVSALTGWVGGYQYGPADFIFRTTDGGATWEEQWSDSGFNVSGMDFVSADSGWVVGFDWRPGEYHAILSTSDGGQTWVEHPTGSRNLLYDVDFVDAQHGWIVANSGDVLYTANGGEGWVTETTGGPNLKCVAFTNQLVGCVATFGGGIYRTTNGGFNWINAAGLGQGINALTFAGDEAWAVGIHGLISHSSDQGYSWQEQSTIATTLSFADVSFLDAERGWAVGSGEIIATSDGGAHWTSQYADTEYYFTGIAFADFMHGIALSQIYYTTPYLLRTTNSGNTWVPQEIGIDFGLNKAIFTDSLTGWMVGHSGIMIIADALIMHTTDAGGTWSSQVLSSIGSDLEDIAFVGNLGWAVGEDGTIVHTTDGGSFWVQQYPGVSNDLFTVCFLDSLVGMVGTTYQTILRTTDGGDNWTSVHGGPWPAISDIVFADASHGWAVGADGLILESTDGGLSWSEYSYGRYPDLHEIVFHDSARGRIFGEYGTILRYGIATSVPPDRVPPIVSEYSLAIYPNPFNSSTRLSYGIPRNEHINLAVYDLTGRLVQTLEDRVIPQGRHSLIFDGAALPSGMYFVRLQARDFSQTRKLLLLK